MTIPFDLYQTRPADNINIPVQQNPPTTDYTIGSSQIMMLNVPNVQVGDLLECDACCAISYNHLPYNMIVGFSIVVGTGHWGQETVGEDIGTNPGWRPYYMPRQHIFWKAGAPVTSLLVAVRIYVATSAKITTGDHCVTIISYGPTGHLDVKRWKK